MMPLALSMGCYAGVRGTVKLVEGDQELAKARSVGAPSRAVYEWTMADEYMKKARDEWARSDFESAEQLVAKAKQWAAQAEKAARTAAPIDDLDDINSIPQVPASESKTDSEEESSWGDDDGVW